MLASASDMDETPETVRHPSGDTGEPQGSQRAPEFSRQRQAGAGFESQQEEEEEDDDDNGSQWLTFHHLTKLTIDYCTIFTIDSLTHVQPQLRIYHPGVSLRSFLQLLRLHPPQNLIF